MAVTILRISEWRWTHFKAVLYWSLPKVLLQQSLVTRCFLMLNHLLFLAFDLNLCTANKKEMSSLQQILTWCSFKSVHSRNLTVILKPLHFQIGPQRWSLWGMSPTCWTCIHEDQYKLSHRTAQRGSHPALLYHHFNLHWYVTKRSKTHGYSTLVLGMAFRGHSWICWKF